MANGNKKLGRPAGSVNRDYEVTTTVSARCRRCQYTKFINRTVLPGGAGVTLRNGIAPDGKEYNLVRSVRAKCANPLCGQWTSILEYELLPIPSKGSEENGVPADEVSNEDREHGMGSGTDYDSAASDDASSKDA